MKKWLSNFWHEWEELIVPIVLMASAIWIFILIPAIILSLLGV